MHWSGSRKSGPLRVCAYLRGIQKSIMRTMRLLSVFIFSIALLPVFSQQAANQRLPLDPKVLQGRLANGLTYYIRENKKPEQKVELRLVVKVGSIMENDDQQGLAHMAEHMAFNGTKNFKKNEIVSFLQDIGVGFGNDLNAYTSFDETVYILPIPTSKPLLRPHDWFSRWPVNCLCDPCWRSKLKEKTHVKR